MVIEKGTLPAMYVRVSVGGNLAQSVTNQLQLPKPLELKKGLHLCKPLILLVLLAGIELATY